MTEANQLMPASIVQPQALSQNAADAKTGAKPQNDFPFAVTVAEVYDGPLDLLLDLIRKQDIDVYDIPIAKLTAQYLTYL